MPNSKFALFSGRFILLLAAIIGTVGIYGYIQQARFHSRLNQLKLAGELVDIDSLVHHVEDEADDSATYLNRIFDDAREISELVPWGEGSVPLKTDPDSLAAFDRMEKEYPEFFTNVSLAVNAPDMSYDKDAAAGWGTDVLSMHSVGWVIFWRGEVQKTRGDINGAANSAVELLKLADKTGHCTILESLCAANLRKLAWQQLFEAGEAGRIDDDILSQVYEATDGLDIMSSYCEALKTERSLTSYYMINDHLVEDGGDFEPSGIHQLARKLPSGSVIAIGNAYLDQSATDIERAQIPLTEDVPVRESNWSMLVAFGADSGYAMDHIRIKFGEHVAKQRATRIALALQQNEQALEQATWSKEFLVSIGVPREMTADPFTGEPMIIKREDDHWLVYSAGGDRVDNGGGDGDFGAVFEAE